MYVVMDLGLSIIVCTYLIFTDLVIGAGFNETVVVLRYVSLQVSRLCYNTDINHRTRPIFQAYTDMSSSLASVGFDSPDCKVNDGSGKIWYIVFVHTLH